MYSYDRRQDLPTACMRGPKYAPAPRQLAVDHFVANGRCLAVATRALGYPSGSLLGRWIRDAYAELRPRVGQAHEALSSEAKQSAVMALCLRQGIGQAPPQYRGSQPQGVRKLFF